jgi:GT2 family glycosyltransferase
MDSPAARPRFTLLICVKDRLDRLRSCLDSLRPLQGEATGELIVACDGGPTSLRRDAGALLDAPGWTSHWFDLPAGGPAKARNAVLPKARGELILFLNDDIRCDPGLLAAHDRAHRARPGHAVMGNTRWAPEVITDDFMHWVAHHDSFYYLIPSASEATWEYFHTMNLSVDRSWFDERGARFDERFPDPAFEDTELGYRLCRDGLKITLAYDAILYHVHHFRYAEYLQKSRMRGRSARHFLALYPELRERILSEYQWQADRLGGWRGVARRLAGRLDGLELMEGKIAREFLEGYREA